MPRNGRIIWLAATLGLVGALRAQDDLGPPPKAPIKAARIPLPADDLGEPPAPKKTPAAKKDAIKPAKDAIDFPGAELPSDPPAVNKKSAPPSSLELPREPKKTSDSQKQKSSSVPPVDSIAFPESDAPKTSDAERKLPAADPLPAPGSPIANEPKSTPIKLSQPVAAQSTRRRIPAMVQPLDSTLTESPQEKAIPAPYPKKTEIIASSSSREVRRAKKDADIEKTKPAVEPAETSPIIEEVAVERTPKPQDQYELVQPRMPNYDVVHSRSSPRPDADALRTVYESPQQLLRGSDGVVQVGATFAEGQGPSIESYQVRIWKIDGWETFLELARMEYRDETLAATLAKYNRSGYRPTDPLPAGQKVRLPPKWVLERSGTTVARRPAPIKSEFTAPPATAVEGQPAGSGIVASSGDRSKPGGLATEGGASPLPKEKAPVETGPVFVVNENGMTLYKVAKRVLGEGSQWKQIYDLNRDRLSSSQSELKIGTRLRLPEGSTVR